MVYDSVMAGHISPIWEIARAKFKIILELKAVSHILPAHEVSQIRHLNEVSMEVEQVNNFAEKRVETRRKIKSRF